MSVSSARWGLVGLSLLAVGGGAIGVMRPIGNGDTMPPVRHLTSSTMTVRTNIDSTLGTAMVRAPFRATRRLTAVPYTLDQAASLASVVVPVQTRPVLNLSGVIWGSEPTAVVEGFPGIEGPRVVRQGDTVSGLKVKRIESMRVVIAGLDTIWNLSIRASWP